jgi:hypothetical protein
VTDPRPRVLPAERAQYTALLAFLRTVRGEFDTVLGASPPRAPWATRDNENVTAMLAVFDAAIDALAAERHVVRFDLPNTGVVAASYHFTGNDISLRPVGDAASLGDVAESLVHEYTHHEQDVTAEELLRAARLPQEHTREDELRQETEARRNGVYFAMLMRLVPRPLGFSTMVSSGLLLQDFERERTGRPAEQAAARASIRQTLEGPYAAQLAANAPGRNYTIEIRSNRHAVVVGMRGVETDLGEVPQTVQTTSALENHLAGALRALPGFATFFDAAPGGQRLAVAMFVVFDAGRRVTDFALAPSSP